MKRRSPNRAAFSLDADVRERSVGRMKKARNKRMQGTHKAY